MKVDGSQGTMIQGVSQQPKRNRLPGQCSSQLNFTSDEVEGLRRRAPLDLVAKIINTTGYSFTEVDTGSDGVFILAYKDSDLRIFDTSGVEYTTTISNGGSYLDTTALVAVSLEDGIYICNPTVDTAMSTDTRSYMESARLVHMLGGQYGRTYKTMIEYSISGSSTTLTYSYTTPDGSSSPHITNISPDYIIGKLRDAMNADSAFTTYFTVDVKAASLVITWTDPSIESVEVTVEDGDANVNIIAVNSSVGDTGDLPAYAPNGYVVTVEESGADSDDWYLEFRTDDDTIAVGSGFGNAGKWYETVAPNIPYKLDETTMPHIITKSGSTFTMDYAVWEDRAAGDETSNADPSFIGSPIRWLDTFQGRLVALSTVNVVMSRNNKPTNFWFQSATGLADDDPIDITSSVGTFELYKSVAHNRDLIIFSNNAQFIVFGRNTLTPQNSSLVLTTEFEGDLSADPVGAGRNIFFPFRMGTFVGMHEYFVEGGTDINDSQGITQHVSKYIPGVPEQLVSSTNFNTLLVRTDTDGTVFYVYEYLWVNREKKQASWSKWVLPDDTHHAFFKDNNLFIISADSTNGFLLNVLDMDRVNDAGVPYQVHLDNKFSTSGVTTTVACPYTVGDYTEYTAVQGAGCPYPGMPVKIVSESGGAFTLAADMGGGTVIIGKRYMSEYVPTPPQPKDSRGAKIDEAKLTVRKHTIHVQSSGKFFVEVTDTYGYTATTEYSGYTLGSPTAIIGEPAVSDGDFSVKVGKRADKYEIRIYTDSPFPLSVLDISWAGQYNKRGRRIEGG